MKTINISLRDIKDFPKPGIVFKDISPLLQKPEELKALISGWKEGWDGKIDIVAGFDARGFIFGSLLAYEMNIPFVMLRKKGKLPGSCETVVYDLEYGSSSLQIQNDAVKTGDRVLLVDDLLATGGTAHAGCELIERLGGTVVGLQFVIELKELSGREKLSSYEVTSTLVV